MINNTDSNTIGSIPPSIWGHSGWKLLFAMAQVYPMDNPTTATKNDYLIYFTHLRKMLPCSRCRKHYSEYILNNPPQFYLHNRESVFHWLLGLHNKSNKYTILNTHQEAINRYLPNIENFSKTDKKNKNKCTTCEHS